MTTYAYTGKLTDFGEAPFPTAVPRVWVETDQDAFGASGLLAARRIPVAVAADGTFSVALVPSVDTTPETRYRIRCEWLDAAGIVAGWAEWEFVAVIGGGAIKDMAVTPVTRFWSGPVAPSNPGPGLWWLDTSEYPYQMREWV